MAGQFEPELKNTQLRGAFKALGFTDIKEVAVGADLCTIEEAKDFMKEVPEKIPFMGTSCCPAWSVMAKKNGSTACQLHFHGAYSHGTDCQTSEAGRARLQDRVCRTMCSQEAGGKP